MARLNEPPVSTDSAETLRRKLLRQNRDLAKLNNIRALRVRELENDCACMLSENVELRGRIIELEKQVENNEAQRIADHAMAIKAKLESQLTEWGTLIAGLGLEPPPKRHSPRISRTSRRWSNTNFRTSPSQRRLRDVAKDIEDLGHISEHKSYSRMSMNPEQIRALRSEADEVDPTDLTNSPELGPPPMSQFINDDPVKVDSPCASPSKHFEPSPKEKMEPPVALPSPRPDSHFERSPSPEKKRDALSHPTKNGLKPDEDRSQEPEQNTSSVFQASAATPTKTGIKRKFALSDESSNTKSTTKTTNENQPPDLMAGKSSIRDRTGGKTLKQLTTMRKEERPTSQSNRRPLSAKSTNDDISSPKKKSKQSTVDEVTTVKAGLKRSKVTQDRPKTKAKTSAPVLVDEVPEPEREPEPAVATATSDLGTPLAEPDLLAPNSPISAPSANASRGDTPPPADISSNGETSRPSRRSRGIVSYAEPNLRDKMRRPTKDLVDAVTGARRSSQYELISHDSANAKREASLGLPPDQGSAQDPGSIPASPLARKSSISQEMANPTIADKRKRQSSATVKENLKQETDASNDESTESVPVSDADLYEFTTSSPRTEKQGKSRTTNRQGKSSRRFSTALENDDSYVPNERVSSRRRSMMV